MNVSYEIDKDEIWCTEEFINIKFNNCHGLTTEQVKNVPLLDKRNKLYSKCVGHLIETDEEYIYGIMYRPSDLYDDRKESFSMEIHYEDEEWLKITKPLPIVHGDCGGTTKEEMMRKLGL